MRNRAAFLPAAALAASLLLAGCLGGTKTTAPENTPPLAAPAPTGNLDAEIVGVDIPPDGRPVVTFTLRDQDGRPLDPVAVLNDFTGSTDGKATGRVRFYIARIKADGNYENYLKGSTGRPSYDISPPAASQFASLGEGRFAYTFNTPLDNDLRTLGGIRLAGSEGLTHTVAIQITRNVRTSVGRTFQQAVNPYFNFRPDGGAVTATREVVSVSACNACHGKLNVHGSRREVALCILCHYPGVTDPTTGNSISLMTIAHKIHYGEKLPSNVAGGDFHIAGVSYKTVAYPFMSADSKVNRTPVKCVKCHSAGKDSLGNDYGRDVARYMQNPTYAKCTSCHDTLKFDGVKSVVVKDNTTLRTVSDDNVILHDSLAGPIILDAAAQPDNAAKCFNASGISCHANAAPEFVGDEFTPFTVPSAHTVVEESSYNFLRNDNVAHFQILAVDNIDLANRAPRVTFRVVCDNGDVVVPSDNASVTSLSMKFGFIPAGSLDYSNNLLENGPFIPPSSRGASQVGPTSPGQPMTLAVAGSRIAVDNLTFNAADKSWTARLSTYGSAYPASAAGTGVVTLEGYVGMRGSAATARKTLSNSTIRFAGRSAQWFFDLATGARVTDPALTRRRVVDTGKCQVCHNVVRLHGGSRINIEECVVCHNASASALSSADNTQHSIDFKYLVHRVHTGEAGGSSYPWGTEIRYPRDRRDCLACHVDTVPLAYGVPLKVGVAPVSVGRGTIKNNDADDPKIGPTRAACTSCHDGASFPLPHILNQTTGSPSNPFELCTQCHMTGLLFGPDFAHEAVR